MWRFCSRSIRGSVTGVVIGIYPSGSSDLHGVATPSAARGPRPRPQPSPRYSIGDPGPVKAAFTDASEVKGVLATPPVARGRSHALGTQLNVGAGLQHVLPFCS